MASTAIQRKRSMDLRAEERREQERRAHGEALFNDSGAPCRKARARSRRPRRSWRRIAAALSSKLPEENILYFLEKTAPRLAGWQRRSRVLSA